MNKTALIIGATGLVGTELTKQLLSDPYFSQVIVFTRSPINLKHKKLINHIDNFENISNWETLIKGDVLFSCMGTTIKKAKTKENQYKIDYTYQYDIARLAKNNEVNSYVLVSAGGANSNSKVFYNRIKGELDDAITKLNFNSITILKPSVLVGKRNEFRFGESIGIVMGRIITLIPGLRKYRPINASIVATAMIYQSKKGLPFSILKYSEIFKIVK